MPPIAAPAGIRFIKQGAVIHRAHDETNLSEYVLYWGSGPAARLRDHGPIAALPVTGGDLVHHFADTGVPEDATHLLVYSKNHGEMEIGVSIALIENDLSAMGTAPVITEVRSLTPSPEPGDDLIIEIAVHSIWTPAGLELVLRFPDDSRMDLGGPRVFTRTGDETWSLRETYALPGDAVPGIYTFIRVAVVDDRGAPGVWSGGDSFAEVAEPPDTPPATASPELNALVIGADSVRLTWQAARDDTTAAANLRYHVYQSQSADLETVESMEANGTRVGELTGMTELTIAGLTDGALYYFNLLVLDEADQKTAYTMVERTITEPPDAPSRLVAYAGDGAVNLSFASVPGAVSYHIYFAHTPDVGNAPAPERLETTTTFTEHAGLENGSLYHYIVKAVGPGGESAPSNEAVALPLPPWTTVTTGYANEFFDVIHDGTQFVAAAANGRDGIYTSPDGLDWTMRRGGSYFAVCHAAGLYVAAGHGHPITSPDTVTWTTRITSNREWIFDIAYGNDMFVAVGNNGAVLTSPDGVDWTIQSKLSNHLRGIAWSGGEFVAVGINPGAYRSADGVNWQRQTTLDNHKYYGIAYGAGRFVAAGFNGVIATSTDGTTWEDRTFMTNGWLRGISFDHDRFIAAAYTGGFVLISPDGINWTNLPGPAGAPLKVVYDGNSKYLAVGETGAAGFESMIAFMPTT